MSLRATAVVWEQSTAAGTELLLMLAIADNANDSGEAFPAVPKLRRRCRLESDRGLQKAIEKRVNAGELVVEPRFHTTADGVVRQTTNLYFLIFRGLDNQHALNRYPVPADTGGMNGGTPGGRTTGHPPGEPAKTPQELSKERLLKQSNEREGGGAASAEKELNKLIALIIGVWVTSWEGVVSGEPYKNKTYRADSKKLAQRTTLADIKRYTLGVKAKGSKWENARPGWGIWINDMGEWLKRHTDPDPDPKTGTGDELSPEKLEQAKRLAARQDKLFGGGQR